MSKSFYESINFTELLAAAKEGHSGFVKAGEKKNIYVNVTLWVNEDPDKYGNTMSLKVNPSKDAQDKGFYIANFKPNKEKEPDPISQADIKLLPDDDDLPF